MLSRITHVTVLVPDHEAGLAFFRDTLGLAVRADEEMPGGDRWVTVAPAGADGPELTLVEADSGPKQEALGAQAGDHVGIVFGTDDCRATYETLTERGVEFHGEPSEVPWGVEVTFEDPWGNVYDLVEAARPPGE